MDFDRTLRSFCSFSVSCCSSRRRRSSEFTRSISSSKFFFFSSAASFSGSVRNHLGSSMGLVLPQIQLSIPVRTRSIQLPVSHHSHHAHADGNGQQAHHDTRQHIGHGADHPPILQQQQCIDGERREGGEGSESAGDQQGPPGTAGRHALIHHHIQDAHQQGAEHVHAQRAPGKAVACHYGDSRGHPVTGQCADSAAHSHSHCHCHVHEPASSSYRRRELTRSSSRKCSSFSRIFCSRPRSVGK